MAQTMSQSQSNQAAEILKRHEQYLTTKFEAQNQRNIEDLLIDHDKQKFNLQAQILELKLKVCQLENKCTDLQKIIQVCNLQKIDAQMSCQYQKEQIVQLNNLVRSLEDIVAKSDQKILNTNKQFEEKIEKMNSQAIINQQNIQNKLKMVTADFKGIIKEKQKKCSDLQTEKQRLEEELNINKNQLSQSLHNNVVIKQELFKLAQNLQCPEFTNQFQIFDQCANKFRQIRKEKQMIIKVLQGREKFKQVKQQTLAKRMLAILKVADAEKQKIQNWLNSIENSLNHLLKAYVQNYEPRYGPQLIEFMNNKFVDIQAQLDLKTQMLSQLSSKETTMVQKYSQKQQQIKNGRKKIKQVQLQLQKQKISHEELKGICQKIKTENRVIILKLEKQIEELKKKQKKDGERWDQQKKQMLKRLEENRYKEEQSKKIITQKNAMNNSYKQNLEQLKKQNEQLKDKISRQNAKSKDVSEEMNKNQLEFKKKIQKLEGELSRAKIQIQQNKNNLINSSKQLEEQKILLKNEQQLKKQMAGINNLLKKNQAEKEDLQDQNKKLKRQLRQQENFIQRILKLQKQLIDLGKKLNQKQSPNSRISSPQEALKIIESNINVTGKNNSDASAPFLSIPCLRQAFTENVNWVKEAISGYSGNKKMETNFLNKHQKQINFNPYMKKNIILVCQSKTQAIFIIMIAKLGERKLDSDTVVLISGNKQIIYPKNKVISKDKVIVTVNKYGVLILGPDNEIMISKQLKVTLACGEKGYFGEINIKEMFDEEPDNQIEITCMEVYEAIFK